MSLESLNNEFQRKINNLTKLILFLKSRAGTEPPKGASVAFFETATLQIQDLYEMLQATMNLIAAFRKRIDQVSAKADNIGAGVIDLKEKYDDTLGSLNDRLKRNNDKDEEKKKKGEDWMTFYG
jgi:hypothetical protein